jgi:hypothetical protein
MPRSLARLSASASSHRDLSSAVFITNIAESDFRYTHPNAWQMKPSIALWMAASHCWQVALELITEHDKISSDLR